MEQKGKVVGVTSGGGPRRQRSNWEFALIVVAIMILAVGAGVGVRWWQHRNDAKGPSKDPLAATFSETFDKTLDGDYDSAHETVNKALKDPTLSTDSQYRLYMEQGSIYQNQEDYSAALASYQKANSIKSTFNSAEAIAYVAELKGDKTLAITYYKKAIPLVPDSEGTKDAIIASYKDSIVRLGGQL